MLGESGTGDGFNIIKEGFWVGVGEIWDGCTGVERTWMWLEEGFGCRFGCKVERFGRGFWEVKGVILWWIWWKYFLYYLIDFEVSV